MLYYYTLQCFKPPAWWFIISPWIWFYTFLELWYTEKIDCQNWPCSETSIPSVYNVRENIQWFFFQLQDYKCNACLRAKHPVSFGSVLWQKISAELAKTALFSCCKSSLCCAHVSTFSTVSKPCCCVMSHWIQCLAAAAGRSQMFVLPFLSRFTTEMLTGEAS